MTPEVGQRFFGKYPIPPYSGRRPDLAGVDEVPNLVKLAAGTDGQLADGQCFGNFADASFSVFFTHFNLSNLTFPIYGVYFNV